MHVNPVLQDLDQAHVTRSPAFSSLVDALILNARWDLVPDSCAPFWDLAYSLD
jgi:hypothetical protein